MATCRGVVAQQPISVDELREGPLISLPDQLIMTAEVATKELEPMIGLRGLPGMWELEEGMQVALLLSHEKTKGVLLVAHYLSICKCGDCQTMENIFSNSNVPQAVHCC